jgi:predicted nucleotidyltransferase
MAKPKFEHVFDDTPVLVAYLFGSHAVGRAGPASDYDIAVLCVSSMVIYAEVMRIGSVAWRDWRSVASNANPSRRAM